MATRRQRYKLTPYGIVYSIIAAFVATGILGHSTFFLQLLQFDVDEPASLIFPFFWAGLLVLLSIDFILYRAQVFLYYYASKGSSFATWGFETLRTKFHISFAQSFGEAASSSFAAAAICAVLHTSIVYNQKDLNNNIKYFPIEWEKYLFLPSNHTLHVHNYIRAFATPSTLTTMASKLNNSNSISKIPGVWLSLMCILIIQHWMERVAHVRGIFFHDDEDVGDTFDSEYDFSIQEDQRCNIRTNKPRKNMVVYSPRKYGSGKNRGKLHRGQAYRKGRLKRRTRSNSFDTNRLHASYWSGKYEPLHKKEMAVRTAYILMYPYNYTFVFHFFFTSIFLQH